MTWINFQPKTEHDCDQAHEYNSINRNHFKKLDESLFNVHQPMDKAMKENIISCLRKMYAIPPKQLVLLVPDVQMIQCTAPNLAAYVPGVLV